jgi:HK97 family phage prohead protease
LDRLGGDFQIKTVDFGSRIISGWAAYHGNVDRVQDIIEPGASQKAVARLTDPAEVGVFIGHDMGRLPVGVPIKIEAHAQGLYTETRIFDGPTGDDLLGAARGLREHGQSLGLSIGYHPHDTRYDRVGGKTVRRLNDYSLREYSFAASQAIANGKALVLGVKTAGGAMYKVKEEGGRWHVMRDDKSLADFARLMDDGDEQPGGKTVRPNTLPDSAFLYVASGGQLDDEGKTVPRSLRYFRVRGADGALDAAALAVALSEIPEAKTVGLDEKSLSSLQTRARALLESADGVERKTVDVTAPEWKQGTPLSLRGLGYRLLDLSERLATDHAAMTVLGDDTKTGERMRPEMRVKVRELSQQLADLVDRAEYVDRHEDGAADIEQRRRHLKMAEVGLW